MAAQKREGATGTPTQRRRTGAIAWAVFLAASLFAPSFASAHGTVSHVPGDADFGVVVGRYQFLLEGKERVVAPGQLDRIVVRIFDMMRGAPLSGARVLAAPKVPQAFKELPPKKGKRASAGANPADHSGVGKNAPPPGGFLAFTPEGRIDLSGFRPAVELADPGHYALEFTPMIKGPYLLQVALLLPGADGRPEVMLTQLPFQVKPPPGINARMWVALGGIFLAFAVGAYALRARVVRAPAPGEAFDLLSLPWLARLMRSPWWQPMFQVPFAVVFAAVLVLGFIDTQESSRNLSTILMWTLWWAGIIFTFVLAGRAWCVMCPIGALTEWTNRLTGADRQFPRRWRTLWVATFLFLLLTWADGYYGIVRSPWRTAALFGLFTVAALAVGALFARRTFCRYLCPIGGIIGLYSMFAPVELRVKSVALCHQDPGKACYVGSEAGQGCPMFEFPQRMDTNAYCIYCGECLKTCCLDNIAIRFRPFGKDLWATGRRTLDEALLAVVMVAVAGTAAGHMVGAWHEWMHALSEYIPFAALGVTEHKTVERVMFTLVFWGTAALLPLLAWGASFLTWDFLGRPADTGPGRIFVLFGYAFIPLGLAMHLAHNLPHLFLEGPMVVPVFVKTVNTFTPWNLGVPDFSPAPWLEMPVLYWLQMLILTTALLFSLYIAYRLALGRWGARAILSLQGPWPFLVLMLAIGLANAYLLNLPMDPRH